MKIIIMLGLLACLMISGLLAYWYAYGAACALMIGGHLSFALLAGMPVIGAALGWHLKGE